jgi:amino acid transporter
MLVRLPHFDWSRLIRFDNFSGLPEGTRDSGEPLAIWPSQGNLAWLFVLGLLLPAYTLTGFDASAHTSEETIGAARAVPRGIVRSVLVSGLFGWVMLCAVVLAAPDVGEAARKGDGAFVAIVDGVVSRGVAITLYVGIALAQYLCGLATITSASRMAFAFARDGGLPFSSGLRFVSPIYRTPVPAIWTVAMLAVAFTAYAKVYETISIVCTIFLYISYVLPTALGLIAYGRRWTRMGPWDLGMWYRPLAVVCILGCGLLLVVGVQPPYELALKVVAVMVGVMLVLWFAVERFRFTGPPRQSIG